MRYRFIIPLSLDHCGVIEVEADDPEIAIDAIINSFDALYEKEMRKEHEKQDKREK